MGPSLTVSEINGDFGRKPQIFSYLHLFITPLGEFLSNFVTAVALKSRLMSIPDGGIDVHSLRYKTTM